METKIMHEGHIENVGGNYCWKPICSCGEPFWGYAAKHAAETLLDAHLSEHAAAPGPSTT